MSITKEEMDRVISLLDNTTYRLRQGAISDQMAAAKLREMADKLDGGDDGR